MGSISDTPLNQNLLQGARFQLNFDRLPYLSFFIQEVNLPGLFSTPAIQPTEGVNIPRAASKAAFEPLVVKFLLDETMYSWTTLHDWLVGITFPDTSDEYANLPLQERLQIQAQNQQPQYSDADLLITTNKNNPLLTAHFIKVFPISLSAVDFNNSVTSDTILTASATFGFTTYFINRRV